jgi:hypothetical protein
MSEHPQQSSYISDTWSSKWDAVMTAQKEGLNWLFTLNVGGVAGTLTYASAKQTSVAVTVALSAFSVGLLALVFFALRYYYYEERMFYDFREDVRRFRASELPWPELIARENARPNKYRSCEIAAWISTGAAVGGIISSAIAIL